MDAVRFDVDGVVVDSVTHWMELEADRSAEVVPAASVEEITGMNRREVYERLEDRYDVSVDREAFAGWYEETARDVYGERACVSATGRGVATCRGPTGPSQAPPSAATRCSATSLERTASRPPAAAAGPGSRPRRRTRAPRRRRRRRPGGSPGR